MGQFKNLIKAAVKACVGCLLLMSGAVYAVTDQNNPSIKQQSIKPLEPVCQLPAYTATYEVQMDDFLIATTMQKLFIYPGHRYKFILGTKSDIKFYQDHLLQMSQGQIINHRLVPDLFDSHQDHKEKNERIDFDWKTGVAHSLMSELSNQKEAKVVLHADAGDLLSSQINLRELLIQHPDQSEFSMDLVKSNKLQTYVFKKKTSIFILSTVLGKIKTVEMERVHGDSVDDYWLAPDYGYLLVKSTQTNHGKLGVVLMLKNYTPESPCLE